MEKRERGICVSEDIKRFDELYLEVYREVEDVDEEKGGPGQGTASIDLSEKLKGERGDERRRVLHLLTHHPSLLLKLTTCIQSHNSPTRGKNEEESKDLLLSYCSGSRRSGASQESLEILNRALCLAPTPEVLLGEEAPFLQSHTPNHPSPALLAKFTNSPTTTMNMDSELEWVLSLNSRDEFQGAQESASSQGPSVDGPKDETRDEPLVAQIYLKRAHWFQENSDHESCIWDMYRAIRCGHRKTFSTLLSLACSYKALERFAEANDLFQAALNLLRNSSADNQLKSTHTIKIVKELKEIKSKSSSQPSSSGLGKRKKDLLSPPLLLYGKQSSCLTAGSEALELKYNPILGRHLIANRNIPPGE